MTPIIAFLIPPATIRVNFPFNKTVNEKLKTIDGYAFVKDGKYWTVPIAQLDALIAKFGDSLAIHPDVLEAKQADEERRVRVFVANCLAAGISLDVVGGRVVGSGGAYCVDPWQREIDARSEAIIALGLGNSPAPASVRVSVREVVEVDESLLTDFDRLAVKQWDVWKRAQVAEDAQRAAEKGRRWWE